MLPVRSIHLHHHNLMSTQEPGETDSPRPGPFHANTFNITVGDEPAEESFVAGYVSRERLCSEYPAVVVYSCCNVLICVGIHTTLDHPYHRHDRPFQLEGRRGVTRHRDRRNGPNPAGISSSTGDPPPNRGVQHRQDHPTQPDMGGARTPVVSPSPLVPWA